LSSAVAALRSGIRIGPRKARAKRGSQPVEHSLLLTATMCLLAFGVVMVFSASSTASLLGETGDGAFYLKRTLMFGAIGVIALRLLSRHGLVAVRRLTPALLAVSFGLLLFTLIPGVGSSANGAQRWIAAGPIQIQASEIAKIALILYGAHLVAARPQLTRDLRSMAPYLLVCGAACGLIAIEPDLGTAMIAAFSVAALLVAAGAKLRSRSSLIGSSASPASSAPVPTPADPASRRRSRRLRWAPGASSAPGSARACRRRSTCPRRTPT
jgi:cell division protein FtsW